MCYVNTERRVIPHSVGKCHAVTKGLGTCQVRRSLQIVHSLIHNKPASDLRLIAFQEVSERSKRFVVALRPLDGERKQIMLNVQSKRVYERIVECAPSARRLLTAYVNSIILLQSFTPSVSMPELTSTAKG